MFNIINSPKGVHDLFQSTVKILFGSLLIIIINSQADAQISVYQLEPRVGKLLLNYPDPPETGILKSIHFTISNLDVSNENKLSSFYNYPLIGATIGFTDFGNKDIFGIEYSLLPFLELNIGKSKKRNYKFSVALGVSYNSTQYDQLSNPQNLGLGGPINWNFNAFIKRKLFEQSAMKTYLGIGLMHTSGGHVELPNFGLNSLAISVSTQFFSKKIDAISYKRAEQNFIDYHSNKFIFVRSGLGLHKLGGARGPVENPQQLVHLYTLGYLWEKNPFVRYKLGATIRKYESYQLFLEENLSNSLSDHPTRNATAAHLFWGAELLLGRVAMDFELGVSIYKPFFETYYELYAAKGKVKKILKKYVQSRLGLNLYLKKPNENHRNNILLGAYLNANFDQADFSEISLTLLHKL